MLYWYGCVPAIAFNPPALQSTSPFMNRTAIIALSLLGAAALLLFTTDKGRQYRGYMADGARAFRRKLQQGVDDAGDAASDLSSKLSDSIGNVAGAMMPHIPMALD